MNESSNCQKKLGVLRTKKEGTEIKVRGIHKSPSYFYQVLITAIYAIKGYKSWGKVEKGLKTGG